MPPPRYEPRTSVTRSESPATPTRMKKTQHALGRLSRSSSVASVGSTDARGSHETRDGSKHGALDEESADAPESVEPEASADSGSELGKLRQVVGILKKTFGVKDLSAVRLSLPANLLEPVGNLEHWHYQSRPDVFAAIGDSDDPLERMLAVCRYAFTKDLKHARQGVCKPYNSALGEQFRCIWEVTPATVNTETHELVCHDFLDPERTIIDPAANLSGTSLTSEKSTMSKRSRATGRSSSQRSSPNMTPITPTDDPASDGILASETKQKLHVSSDGSSIGSSSNLASTSTARTSVSSADGPHMKRDQPPAKTRIIFVNEQISHHPPISAFWNESSPAGGRGQRVIAYGYDHLSAKFTGTSVKVFAGPTNKGIFVRLPDRGDEEYQITHPVANIAGFFRGSLYVTVSDNTYITCKKAQSGQHLRALISYIDESWLGKPKYGLEGVVYECDPTSPPNEYKKIKEVPEERILAHFAGSWRGKITFNRTKGDDTSEHTLIDLSALLVVPKIVRPPSKQNPRECRRFWAKVSEAIRQKEFSQATKHKQAIEQAQRDAAAARSKKGEEWVPAFFPAAISEDGRPRLTEGGEKARQEELKGDNYLPVDEDEAA